MSVRTRQRGRDRKPYCAAVIVAWLREAAAGWYTGASAVIHRDMPVLARIARHRYDKVQHENLENRCPGCHRVIFDPTMQTVSFTYLATKAVRCPRHRLERRLVLHDCVASVASVRLHLSDIRPFVKTENFCLFTTWPPDRRWIWLGYEKMRQYSQPSFLWYRPSCVEGAMREVLLP